MNGGLISEQLVNYITPQWANCSLKMCYQTKNEALKFLVESCM
jgi:hypothetical protein